MTYADASALVQEYTELPLLESLKQIKATLELEEESNTLPTEIKVAYYTLMAGFTEMFG